MESTPTLKRNRLTAAELEQLEQQIIEALGEVHPQSVRHVYYLMTNPRLAQPVEKTNNGYRRVQETLKQLRIDGRVPFDWLVDSTRRGTFVNTYDSPSDFIRRKTSQYRSDPWLEAEHHCEVWTESRSIAGVIDDDCHELAVTLYASGGFTSLTLAKDAAKNINDTAVKPVVVFYVGDYDPAGVLIDRHIEQELRRHLNRDIDLTFRRVAITAEQIEEYDLPTKLRKETDRRALHIEGTVEAEAMPVPILRGLLRSEIEALLPSGALQAAEARDKAARKLLDKLAKKIEAARKES